MIFPSLPTDNMFKLLLLGAIVAMVLSVNSIFESDKEYELKIDEISLKRLELKYENKLDSIEIISIQKQINGLRAKLKYSNNADKISLMEKIDTNLLLLSKKMILKTKRVDEIDFLALKAYNDYDHLINLKLTFYSIGGIVFAFIFVYLLDIDVYVSKSAKHRMKKELKEIPCQSCGMILKNGIQPHIEAEFCNTCFDGEKYREPDLTYNEMAERIQKNLRDKKFKEKEIKAHISGLKKLNRWTRTFRWQST